MAYFDTAHFDQKPAAPLAWEALVARLDMRRVETAVPASAVVEGTLHLRHVQQMLIAATLGSCTIVTVAAVMMLAFL